MHHSRFYQSPSGASADLLTTPPLTSPVSQAQIYGSGALDLKTPSHSAVCTDIMPLPKNSLIVLNLSRLLCSASWNISCRSADSSCAFRKARMLLLAPEHFGHSASSPPTWLRQRWWKECLQRKCTVGRSRLPPQAEQRLV